MKIHFLAKFLMSQKLSIFPHCVSTVFAENVGSDGDQRIFGDLGINGGDVSSINKSRLVSLISLNLRY